MVKTSWSVSSSRIELVYCYKKEMFTSLELREAGITRYSVKSLTAGFSNYYEMLPAYSSSVLD
jgi:hypothetical protein